MLPLLHPKFLYMDGLSLYYAGPVLHIGTKPIVS